MEKSLFEQMGGTYTLVGDYYLPNLLPAEQEEKPIGIWGQRRLRYLKQHRRVLYTNLLVSGKLSEHLAEIDKQADDMFFRLIKEMAEREGVTEMFKAENQMAWVGRMNNIRNIATEIINNDIIYILNFHKIRPSTHIEQTVLSYFN